MHFITPSRICFNTTTKATFIPCHHKWREIRCQLSEKIGLQQTSVNSECKHIFQTFKHHFFFRIWFEREHTIRSISPVLDHNLNATFCLIIMLSASGNDPIRQCVNSSDERTCATLCINYSFMHMHSRNYYCYQCHRTHE